MKKNILVYMTALSLLSPIVSTAYAEEVFTTGQVVVSATRTEQFIEDVSANIQVITSEEIKAIGASTVMEALRVAQGVQVTSKLSIRGMPAEGTTILINGRRPAGELKFGTGANRTLERIDIHRVERIEVLSGPSSALYGSTTGGVINIITKDSQEASALAGVAIGSRKFRNYYTLDTGKFGAFSFLANASYIKHSPETDEFDDDKSSDGTETYMDFDLGYDINEDHKLSFLGDFFVEDYFTENATGVESREEAQRASFTANYEGSIGDHFYNVTATYSVLDEILKETENNLYHQYTLELKDSWEINENHLLTFGGEISQKNIDAEITAEPVNETSFAFYVQDEISLFDETLFITPALRVDHFEAWGTQLSPKLGTTWKFHENQRIKANFGLGFRAPQFDELYRQSGPSTKNGNTGYYVGNPDLKPEESTSWDISYEGEYKNFSGSVTYFHNDIKNLIGGWDWVVGASSVPGDTNAGHFTFLSTDEAMTQGIELAMSYDFLDYFTLSGQYTWLNAEDTQTDEQLSGTAEHTYLVQLIFTQPKWGTTFAVTNTWVNSMRPSSNSDKQIDYNTTNVSARQQIKENFTVYASVDNIFDSINTRSNSYIKPREWEIGFEVKF